MEKTLRDEFAMAALTGILSHSLDHNTAAVRWAYELADAMLVERGERAAKQYTDNIAKIIEQWKNEESP